MKTNLHELFTKLVCGDISVAEYKLLRDAAEELSDRELEKILADVWEKYEGRADAPSFDEIARRLPAGTEKPRKKPLTRLVRWGAAAAVVAMAVMLGVTQHRNRALENFMERQVTLSVRSGEKAEVQLPDGTTVYMNAQTVVEYPSDFGLANRSLRLSGEAYFDVTKDAGRPFRVEVEGGAVEVLGTSFNVNAYPGSDIVETTLVEGAVRFTSHNGKEVTLAPRQKAIYHRQYDLLTVNPTNTQFETAWTRGELVFRSAQFSDMMKKLEQRYGVTIHLIGNKYDSDLFTGSFKENYVNGVLNILQVHYGFTYTENNGVITVKFR